MLLIIALYYSVIFFRCPLSVLTYFLKLFKSDAINDLPCITLLSESLSNFSFPSSSISLCILLY